MKLLKYTFRNESLEIDENGEIQEVEGQTVTLSFSLLLNGQQLFEDLYGKPFMVAVSGNSIKNQALKQMNEAGQKKKLAEDTATSVNELLYNSKFILTLAASSYVKVIDGEIVNNASTAEEFMNFPFVTQIPNDMSFITKLLDMALGSLPENKKSKSEDKNNSSKKL